jgi:hypothetical protein
VADVDPAFALTVRNQCFDTRSTGSLNELPMSYPIYIGRGSRDAMLLPALATRHGLIAGATGTGKTVTLRILAEQFSRLGVPVFVADVKGDLSGLARPGAASPKLAERVQQLSLPPLAFEGFPVVFWDVFGVQGHPVRTTISEMGPLVLARLLGLNETQSGVLSLTFKVADDGGLLLLDLKDLRAMLQHVGDNAKLYRTTYGNISPASVGAIQRALLTLEEQGAERFFGEPSLAIQDFLLNDSSGRGVINVLAADKLLQAPQLYASFLLWMLAELFELLPEVGDVEKPRLLFFFDEAHLLFDDAPKALLDRIEQVVRLIRSKGVGIYFVTQNPLDIPDSVLGQLGNRIQHALRAFTPKEKKLVKAVAETFRTNPELDTETALTELGIGEALASTLDEQGIPTPVERVWVFPPTSQLPPLAPQDRAAVMRQSPLFGRYEQAVDRPSAYEQLRGRAAESTSNVNGPRREEAARVPAGGATPRRRPAAERARPAASTASGNALDAFASSAARAAGSQVGRQILRGLFGSIVGAAERSGGRRKR